MNNVVNVDGYYFRPWLMERIGSIGTRKFAMAFATEILYLKVSKYFEKCSVKAKSNQKVSKYNRKSKRAKPINTVDLTTLLVISWRFEALLFLFLLLFYCFFTFMGSGLSGSVSGFQSPSLIRLLDKDASRMWQI